MRRVVPFALALMLGVCTSGLASGAEKEKSPAGEILTAIDVVNLLKGGSSEADIAKRLAEQRGYDRDSALKKGKTDAQIIDYLITGTVYAKDVPDKGKSIRSKFEADRYFKESKFDKAAADYTVAIRYARDKYDQYQGRGDSYRKYLKSSLPPASGKSDAGPGNPASIGRALVCSAIDSDYRNALKLNTEVIRKIDSNIKALNEKMSKKELVGTTSDGKVAPYHSKAAGNIQGMREMDVLYRSRVIARQTDIDIKKAMADTKSICRGGIPAPPEPAKKGQVSK